MKKKDIGQDARYAAKIYADATREKLAEIYATALFDACDAMNESHDVLWEEYDSFLRTVCDPYPKFEEILKSESVPVDEKIRMIDSLCGGATAVFRNFLKTLAKRGRMEFLRDARLACKKIDDKKRGRVAVKITSAIPLNEELRRKLVERLREIVGGKPVLFVEVDPSVIGGIVVRVGDVVYDASIANQLNKALQEMINRSAYEIQSRRDSFRNSEGN